MPWEEKGEALEVCTVCQVCQESRLSLMAAGTHRQVTRSDFIRNSSFLPACSFAGSQQRVCTQDLSFLIIALCNLLLPGNKSVFVRKPWIMGKYAEMKTVFPLTWATDDNVNFRSVRRWSPSARHYSLPQTTFSCFEVMNSASPERNQPLHLWLFQSLASAQESW